MTTNDKNFLRSLDFSMILRQLVNLIINNPFESAKIIKMIKNDKRYDNQLEWINVDVIEKLALKKEDQNDQTH